MSAQGPQYHGTKKKIGEEGRFRENTAAQTPLPTRGQMFTRPLPGGRSLEPRKQPAAASTTHNFKVTVFYDGETPKYRVAEGTIRGDTPTLGGVPITGEASGTLTGSGTEYIWIEVTGTYELNVAGDFVIAFVSPTHTIQNDTTEPVLNHDTSDGIFRILIARIVDGVVQRPQPVRNSLDYFVEDTFQGNAEAEISVWGV